MALTVLVFNDGLTQRRLLEAAINNHGYDIETGESGEAAIAFMQSEKNRERSPDVVGISKIGPEQV